MNTTWSVATSVQHACMTGKGWQEYQQSCTPDASFTHEGEMFADTHALEAYAAFMQSAFTPIPDFGHEVVSVGIDQQQRVFIHSLVRGTHTGEGFPVPPTGKGMASHCVLILSFENERIRHAARAWNDHGATRQLGWV